MTRSRFILILACAVGLGFVIGAVGMYYQMQGSCPMAYHTDDPEAMKHLEIGREVVRVFQVKRDLEEDLRREFADDPNVVVREDGSITFK